MLKKYCRPLLIILLVFLSYANTLTLDYALDDRLVIYENDYTLKGWNGIKDILTQDSFSGFFSENKNLVAGGRYRPLAQISFLIEYELFGGDLKEKIDPNDKTSNEDLFSESSLPIISHLMNILYYMLLSLLIYIVLKKLFAKYDSEQWWRSLPFLATLFFALHPLHTEAVANIKGRDEIFCMLGAFAALLFSFKYIEKGKIHHLLLAFISMTFALFSKENAIVFIAILPLALYFYDKKIEVKYYIITELPLLIAVIFFLIVRQNVLGAFMVEDTTFNILNNPFLHCTFAERLATIIITWGLYLKLMIFPHPLTHDYYPHQVEITNFSNPWVIFLTIILISLLVWSVIALKKKKLVSFSILFFIITFSITSNLFFTVGTLMNERFLFVPLLGFCLLFAQLFLTLSNKIKINRVWQISIIIILCMYGSKTFARNFVWKNDITLFTTDVKVSKNSIKCNVSAGGSYLKLYKKEKNQKNFRHSEKYLQKAISLDPTNYNGLLLLGELYYYQENYAQSLYYYQLLAQYYPNNPLPTQNINIVQSAIANNFITNINNLLAENKIQDAWIQLGEELTTNPKNADLLNLKGKIFGQYMGNLDSARFYLQRALEINPDYVPALENMGVAYAIEEKNKEALLYLNRALELAPTNKNILQNLIKLYESEGDKEKANQLKLKLHE